MTRRAATARDRFETAYLELLAAANEMRHAAAEEAGQPLGEIPIIIQIVCDTYRVTIDQICAKGKQDHVVVARSAAMWLSRRLTRHSYQSIISFFGREDHGTALYAVKYIEERMSVEPAFRVAMQKLRQRAFEALGN